LFYPVLPLCPDPLLVTNIYRSKLNSLYPFLLQGVIINRRFVLDTALSPPESTLYPRLAQNGCGKNNCRSPLPSMTTSSLLTFDTAGVATVASNPAVVASAKASVVVKGICVHHGPFCYGSGKSIGCCQRFGQNTLFRSTAV
jgi:hypothetical protein